MVAALGTALSPVGEAPTLLRQAYVFVAALGTAPAETDLVKLERIRAAFPAFYAAGTGGRGAVDPRLN